MIRNWSTLIMPISLQPKLVRPFSAEATDHLKIPEHQSKEITRESGILPGWPMREKSRNLTQSLSSKTLTKKLEKNTVKNDSVDANTWDKAGRTWLMFQRLMPTFGVFSIGHLPSEQGSRRSPAPRLYWTQVQYRPITHTNTKTGTSQITLPSL